MNPKLEAAVRYVKHRGLDVDRPDTEYAALSGLSEKTVKRNRAGITSYYKQATSIAAPEAAVMDARFIEHLFIKTKLNSFRDVLGVLCGYLLVYRGEGLKEVKQYSQIVNLGQAFVDILLRVLSRKDYSAGVPIHSSSKSLSYLKRLDKAYPFLKSYFSINDKYYAGAFSKRHTLTRRTEVLIKQLGVLLSNNLATYVQLLGKHMAGSALNGTNKLLDDRQQLDVKPMALPELLYQLPVLYRPPFICLSGKWTSAISKDFICLDVNDLVQLSLPSLLHVMGIAFLGGDHRTIVVPLKNLSSTNPDHGRHYNIFTRLRSDERKGLGYINYDISGGIQIISFSILYKYEPSWYQAVDDLMDAYPMIFSYGWFPEYKKQLRADLAAQLDISVDEVKQLLTAYANGSNKSIGKNDLLQQFRDESDRLRREVIVAVETHNQWLRKQAESQSKHSFPEDFDWENRDEDDGMARQKSSVFFFIWTYFEKQIRDAMLSVVDDGIPVHDAIYSKHKLPFHVFTDAIEKQTGFQVHVTH
jgi:hypothetical protein